MAIPVMQFPNVQVPQDPSGLMSGIQAGLNMYTQLMNMKNQSRQSRAQQQQQEAQTALMQAQLPRTQAQTEQIKAQTSNLPTQNLLSAMRLSQQQDQLSQSRNRFGQFYQMKQFASTPAGAAAIANDDAMAGNYLEAAYNASKGAVQAGQLQPSSTKNSILDQIIQHSVAQSNLKTDQSGIFQPADQPKIEISPQSAPQNISSPNGISFFDQNGAPLYVEKLPTQVQEAAQHVTKSQIDSFKDASHDTFQKQTNTANILNQRKAITSLSESMDDAKKHLAGYLDYIGAAKKANILASKFETAGGKNNPHFNDYIIMKETILPTIAGEYRKMQGGQASDNEQKMINQIVNPDSWWYNSEAALEKLNAVRDQARGFSRSLSASQSDTQRKLSEISREKGDFFKMTTQEAGNQKKIKAPNGKEYTIEELRQIAGQSRGG